MRIGVGTAQPAAVEPGYDEALCDAPAYSAILGPVASADLEQLRDDVQRDVDHAGVRFESADGAVEFLVDPIPRVLRAAEWDALAAGLAQRVRALEHFVADVYGEQRIVAEGVVPARAIETASYYEPQLAGASVPTWIPVAGLDVVRDVDGAFLVLEDNLRTPSGLAYALAVREAVTAAVAVPASRSLRTLAQLPDQLAGALRAVAPVGVDEPVAVLLTDGRHNSAFYEHARLAQLLGVALVRPEQLELRHGSLLARIDGQRLPVHVVYRRTDADRLFGADGELTAIGELLAEPWMGGRVGLVNAFGAGVADDKLIHRYVENMVRFYLGEEPLVASVPTYDLGQAEMLEEVRDRLGELVVKPRDGHGGHGVVIGPAAADHQLSALREAISARPQAFVAQELIALSHHPTVCDGALHPRHIDLRPFVFTTGESVEVIPGGLTRVALEAGSLVVNSSRNGGAKDTWVLGP